jgi:bacteriocin-like protein
MKKSNIQIKKLSKTELKKINGGNSNNCDMQCLCLNPGGDPYIGVCDVKGFCC